jgi:hypothetical protein
MPRVKQSNPKRVESQPTVSDALPVDVFAPGEDGVAPAVEAKVSPKKAATRAAKVKPCQRCEERRAREREYAKSSRLRHRLARGDGPSPTTPATSPADGAAPAAAADTPAPAS